MELDTFLEMPVRKLMREVVLALTAQTNLAAAARLFAERHITGAPVINAAGEPVGVVSQSDLLRTEGVRTKTTGPSMYYLLLHGDSQIVGSFPDIGEQAGVVEDVMTRRVLSVKGTDTLRDAIATMLREEVHRVLVVDQQKLVGILSSMDVMRHLLPGDAPKSTSGF